MQSYGNKNAEARTIRCQCQQKRTPKRIRTYSLREPVFQPRMRNMERLESIGLAPWASRRRRDLLELLDRLTPTIAELTAVIEKEVEKSRGAAAANASGSGCADGVGVRADYRASGTVRVWQADRVLSGTGATGRFEWTATAVGAHQETRQLVVAFSAGRGGASDRAEPSRNGGVSTVTWRCGEAGRPPRSRWRESSRYVSIG